MRGLAIASAIILTLSGVSLAVTPSLSEAERLYLVGSQFLAEGNPQAAYNRWRLALSIYRQLNHQAGIRKTLIRQSQAFEQLGQFRDACQTVLSAFDLELDHLCNTQAENATLDEVLRQMPQQPQGVDGLQSLATSLRRLGKLELATQALEALLQQTTLAGQDRILAQLELANLQRSHFLRSQQQYQLSEAQTKVQAVLKGVTSGQAGFSQYRALFESDYPEVRVAARINWLMLYADLNDWIAGEAPGLVPELIALRDSQKVNLSTFASELTSQTPDGKLTAMAEVYSHLKVADSLLRLLEVKAEPSLQPSTWQVAFTQAQIAQQGAEQLTNPRAQSQAWGIMAQLYEQSQDLSRAENAYETARALALSVRAADLGYQWDAALGRLAQDAGHTQKALQFYASAVAHLDTLRGILFTSAPDNQVTFRETVAPIYQAYLALLLEQPKPDLETILTLHEQFKVAELESYLRCARLNYVPLHTIPDQIRPTTIHILDLEPQIAVIVRGKDGTLKRFSPNAQKVRASVNSLIPAIQDQRFRSMDSQAYLPQLKVLYDELLAPAASTGLLPQSDPLMFVVDSFMQNLPMAMLHDGQHYLLERYSITNNLGVQVRQPQPLGKPQKLLFAGLSEINPALTFPTANPLPDVMLEAALIADEIKSSTQLLDKDFTWQQFQTVTQRNSPQIIHISTHGRFSSDPRQTYLLAWDQPIHLSEIQAFFERYTQQNRVTPALLFLNACETAKGDRNAALGIAGITIQSGASSTIASLWAVDSLSTTKLSQYFYQALATGKSRAESLRLAQLALLQNPEYQHPYYWAASILLGSWL